MAVGSGGASCDLTPVYFSSAGHAGPGVGGSALLHHPAVLVEVPVHVGGLLCRHQLRPLQGHAQTAVLQDDQVVQPQAAAAPAASGSDQNQNFSSPAGWSTSGSC